MSQRRLEGTTWLALTHRALDEAVLVAYGWPHDLSDEENLARLLALNLQRVEQQKDHPKITSPDSAL